jgi:hypothetical protein
MACLTFFDLSAPLSTTFTCFGTMAGTNNTDVYEWNVNIKGTADSVWSEWGMLDRLGRWEMHMGSAPSVLLSFTRVRHVGQTGKVGDAHGQCPFCSPEFH